VTCKSKQSPCSLQISAVALPVEQTSYGCTQTTRYGYNTHLLPCSCVFGLKSPREKQISFNNYPPPPTTKKFVFLVFLLCRNTVKAAPPPPPNFLNIMRYGSKPHSSFRKLLMFYQSKGQSDVFLFLGRRCEFENPQSTDPRKTREKGIESEKVNVSWYCH
jgi:hypothetical protein